MPNLVCKHCNKEFYSKHSVQLFCNKQCYKNHAGKTEEIKKLVPNYQKDRKKVKNLLFQKGPFHKYAKDFKDKIINYPSAPMGKAYIGVAKEPLMKADGFGYLGVLMQDESRRLVQCHNCGKWAKTLTTHVPQCTGLTTREYKQKYGLDLGKGLVADASSLKLTKAALKNKQSQNEKLRLVEIGRNYTRNGIGRKASIQQRNIFGTCPEQLKSRLYDFIICNREFPNEHNRGKSLYKAIVRYYGRFGAALKDFHLPSLKRQGTNYIFTFPDYTIKTFNINRFEERESLFNILIEKCKTLKNSLTSPYANNNF